MDPEIENRLAATEHVCCWFFMLLFTVGLVGAVLFYTAFYAPLERRLEYLEMRYREQAAQPQSP